MYYVIYDNEYTMAGYMSYKDIVGYAEDVCGKSLKEIGYTPFPGIVSEPQCESEYLMAARDVLDEHWGLFKYFPPSDTGEFLWEAAEHGIEEQAIKLVKQHDPEYARIEFGEQA